MSPESFDFTKLDPTKLDEHAKTDPVARRVAEHLDKIPTIMTVRYLGRLTDTFIFITDLLDVYEVARKQMVTRKMHGIPDMLKEYVKPQTPKEGIDFLTKAVEVQFEKKVRQYEPWLLNQGLVMLCTILDVFFEHALEVIFTKHVQLMYRPDEARNIHLKTVVELGSIEAVVADFRQREVRRFGFLDIDKRLQYLESRCKIPTKDIFDWASYTPEVQQQFKDWNTNKLQKIFEDRHSVVHVDKLPLTKRVELEEIKEFFDKIVLNLSRVAKKAQDVWTEFDRFLATVELYQRFMSEQTIARE
jgi:hypothetical protein